MITSPVLWEASMLALFDAGMRHVLEPAPQRQLTNMLRRYEQESEVTTCADAAELEQLGAWPPATGGEG